MPRKIRELEADLRKAGFTRQLGKGSHRRWVHPLYPGHVAMSGQEGADAKRYQERQVAEAIPDSTRRRGEAAMSAASGTNGQQPHYSMVIEWSDEDQTYIVSIPEFPGNYTHGDTYEEAVQQGQDLIASLIMWTLRDGKPLPRPKVFAGS